MRCIACDKELEVSESRWDEERGEHDDMCKLCLSTIYDEDGELEIILKNNPNEEDFGDDDES